MALIDDYRGQADECRRSAETESDPADRSVWLFLEEAWTRLSDEAPKMLEAASSEKPRPGKSRGKRR